MQQPCSNAVAVGGKLDISRHREEIRRLVAEAPDEPTYGEFKQTLSYSTKKETGELVKDVSSFANVDLEALGGHGYIVFGVANDGRVMGVDGLTGDPASEIRQKVNGHLDRPVDFEYVTCEVDDKAGGTKRVAAIVVPDSRRRPHIISREVTERLNGKEKFWLRKREVWVGKTGGRELATAEDIDAMYESKLRRLVDERVQPLTERVQRLERDLQEQKSVTPELSFGVAVSPGTEKSLDGTPYPVLDNLIDVSWIDEQIRWANKRAAERSASQGPWGTRVTLGPSPETYRNYGMQVRYWFQELEDLLVIDFVLLNTGRVPAEDVEVILEVPAGLRPREELPEKPDKPRDRGMSDFSPSLLRAAVTKQNTPDSLIGPQIRRGTSSAVEAIWEVGRLYHDRPLITDSDAEEVGGLLISGKGYREHLSQAGGEVRLDYAVRAANVPDVVRGSLSLR